MATTDRVRELIEPIVAGESADIYDIEHNGGILRILVDCDGGVDVARLRAISRAISRMFDEVDPIAGRYTLEVSSPGLERPLRTPDHFRGAVGAEIKVKTRREVQGRRRFVGVVAAVDDEGFRIESEGTTTRISYDDLSKARTTFDWGPAPKPGGKNNKKSDSKISKTPHREATP